MKELLIMAKSLGGGGSEVALIELINALPEEAYNITLVLLDSDNEYEETLKKLVATYNLEEQFVFLGRKDNPYSYMKNCDLYVQPSRHEGYGLTIVEARVLGLPIVVSNIRPLAEQIQDGVNGYVAELSAEAMADKIEYLYSNPSQMEKTVEYLKEHPIDFSAELQKLETI